MSCLLSIMYSNRYIYLIKSHNFRADMSQTSNKIIFRVGMQNF